MISIVNARRLHTVLVAGLLLFCGLLSVHAQGLTASTSVLYYGGSVTFTMIMQGTSGAQVEFLDGGSKILGTASLTNNSAQLVVQDTYSSGLSSSSSSGTHTITAKYMPSGATSNAVTVRVMPITPTITWAAPTAITYGTALSSTQLDATANALGTMAYKPAAGSVPAAGTNTLSVTFTPTDATDYTTATGSVSLTVSKAPLKVTANSVTRAYGAANPAFTATYSGFVNGDTSSVLSGLPSLTTAASSTSAVGTYAITAATGTLAATSYSLSYVNGTLAIVEAAPTLSVATSGTPSIYGQSITFTATASSSLSGAQVTFYDYGVPIGTSTMSGATAAFTTKTLNIGTHSVVATLAGSANYATASSIAISQTVYSATYDGGKSVYQYSAVYDGLGNVAGYTDSVTGAWAINYDHLNRLSAATQTPTTGATQYYCWNYDSFGNRTDQRVTTNAGFANAPGYACQADSGASLVENEWAEFTIDGTTNTADNGKNQITGSPAGIYQYDNGHANAGNITNDGRNQYLYDGDGRICAVKSLLNGSMTGYVYDAGGTRVAKGNITTLSCDPGISLFTTTSDYISGPSGEQLSEYTMTSSGSTNTMTWQHSNVWAAGRLLATYDQTGALHFYLDDPLGTRRVQTNYASVVETTCSSLPFGDGESCAPTPTEHLFTAKERDTESGNDYFGARYYASAMGRFMSPDWSAREEPVPYAKLDDPQTLNLYLSLIHI